MHFCVPTRSKASELELLKQCGVHGLRVRLAGNGWWSHRAEIVDKTRTTSDSISFLSQSQMSLLRFWRSQSHLLCKNCWPPSSYVQPEAPVYESVRVRPVFPSQWDFCPPSRTGHWKVCCCSKRSLKWIRNGSCVLMSDEPRHINHRQASALKLSWTKDLRALPAVVFICRGLILTMRTQEPFLISSAIACCNSIPFNDPWRWRTKSHWLGNYGTNSDWFVHRSFLAARKIDGGQQFLPEQMTFGFSKKTQKRHFEIWDKKWNTIRCVRVYRQFQPMWFITRFPPDDAQAMDTTLLSNSSSRSFWPKWDAKIIYGST